MSRLTAAPRSLALVVALGSFLAPRIAPAQEVDANPAKGSAEAPVSGAEAEEKDETAPAALLEERIEVRGRAQSRLGSADSATAGTVGAIDLASRPLLRPGELLEAVPGLILTQHSGGGKANQFFLRGFNLDHGTDFRTSVAGMPINLPSHGHGQGYTDINFLIPELVAGVEYRKGPYSARDADFSASGAIEIDYVDELADALAELTAGEDGFVRLVGADSIPLSNGATLLGGIEILTNDGPWQRPENLERGSAMLRYTGGDARRTSRITGIAFGSEWDATDQVARRAVESGSIGRFGNVDDTLGGDTSRIALAGDWTWAKDNGTFQIESYAYRYDLTLFSNFTYFLDDPVNGDQFEQADERWVVGAGFERERRVRWGGRDLDLAWGLALRADDIDNGLYATRERERLSVKREDSIEQLSGGPFVEARVAWTDWFRTTAGWRLDLYAVDVESNLPENSDSIERAIGSPKLALVFGPWAKTELYVNAGYGFHSNDARGATIRVDPATGEPADRVDPLVRARAIDVGLRGEWLDGLSTTVALFELELDSELLFVGDAGTTEASRPSRRRGVEIANFYRPNEWLSFELDASFSRGRFSDEAEGGDHIPGAIESVVSASATVDPAGSGWNASLRLRYFGGRSLIEDDSVRSASSTLVNGAFGWDFEGGWGVALDVFNLLDEEASDIDYYYASRLPGEPEEGVEDVHFHPSEPRSLRVSLRKTF